MEPHSPQVPASAGQKLVWITLLARVLKQARGASQGCNCSHFLPKPAIDSTSSKFLLDGSSF